jgi:hypothetical protein
LLSFIKLTFRIDDGDRATSELTHREELLYGSHWVVIDVLVLVFALD